MAVFVSAVFTVSAQSADDIIAKCITAIGGAEKWSKVQSIKIEGQIEVQGIQIPFTMQGLQLKGMRVDAEFQGNKIIDNVPTCGVVILEFNIDRWEDLNKGTTLKTLFPKDLKNK